MVNDENTVGNKDKLHEFYIGEITTLTIENVLVPTLMTSEAYNEFCLKRYQENKPAHAFFMPDEITDNHNRKLKLYCHTLENDNIIQYYKLVQ